MLRTLIVLTLCTLLASCQRAPTTADTGTTTEPAARRIVALSPALALMLRDLGLEDQVVGRHEYDEVLAASVPVVGEVGAVDYEALLALDPTHVYTQFEAAGVPERLRDLAAEHGWHLEDYRLLTLDNVAHAIDDLYMDLVFDPDTPAPDLADTLLGGAAERPPSIDPTTRMPDWLPSDRLADAWRDRGPAVRGAGRVLILIATDPPQALGPGSAHHDMLTRMGGEAAITEGTPWMELDSEDVLTLAPDSIVLIKPRTPSRDDDFARPARTWTEIEAALGPLAELPIPAVEHRRVVWIDDPHGLLPSTSLARVAEQMGDALASWSRAGDVDSGP